MRVFNIHEAKTQLSRLVEQAAKGEAFVIAKAGKQLVKVVPLDQGDKPKKRIGFMKGEMKIPDDFDTMAQKEIAAMFGVED
ncbi:MAG: type II toxin-antitoxin system prevent-host-death family antitoxin [Parvularculaceae bacterium]